MGKIYKGNGSYLAFVQDKRKGKSHLYWVKGLTSDLYNATYTVRVDKTDYSYKIWNDNRKRVIFEGKVNPKVKNPEHSVKGLIKRRLLKVGVRFVERGGLYGPQKDESYV